jgi:hypothetical protein
VTNYEFLKDTTFCFLHMFFLFKNCPLSQQSSWGLEDQPEDTGSSEGDQNIHARRSNLKLWRCGPGLNSKLWGIAARGAANNG